MDTYKHSMHSPKIVQIGWGHHVDFRVWKKSAITFVEGWRNALQWNSQQNSNLFIHEYAFENVVCEMAAISSRWDELTLWDPGTQYGVVDSFIASSNDS